jgi:hypothetical protein
MISWLKGLIEYRLADALSDERWSFFGLLAFRCILLAEALGH